MIRVLILLILLMPVLTTACGAHTSASSTTSATTTARTVQRPSVVKPVRTKLRAVICEGSGRRTAASPTKGDYKRLKRDAPKLQRELKAGKEPQRPTELYLHRLPSGKFKGTCAYGPGGDVAVAAY